MIIFVCHRVSDRDIARVAREGCASFDELQFALGVATRCAKCHDCARDTFHQHTAVVGAQSGLPAGCAGRVHGAPVRIAVHRRRETTHAAA